MGDLTLFEALTGGAFDRGNGNIAGLTKIFLKSQMPRGLPGGGWAVLELTGTLGFVSTLAKEIIRLPISISPGFFCDSLFF